MCHLDGCNTGLCRFKSRAGYRQTGVRTNSSAALPVKGAGFAAGDGSLCKLSLTVPASSRKGFRDSGLGGGSIGESWPDATGEVVRLRKGLLEGRPREPAAFASIRGRSWSVTVSLSIVSAGEGGFGGEAAQNDGLAIPNRKQRGRNM